MAWDSQTAKNWWSGESEAFARVMDAMEKGTAKIIEVEQTSEDGPYKQLAITAGGHPGYDTLYLQPTGQPNVYQFSTYNQVAGGAIHGVIAANPETGQYLPVQDYTKQIQYTPGSPGGWARNVIGDVGDMLKSMGPLPMIVGNAILPGAGSALAAVLALDEGNKTGAVLNALSAGSNLSADAAANALAAEVSGNADLANQYSSGVQGALAQNAGAIKTASDTAQLANAIDKGNLAGALNAAGNLTGVSGSPEVRTGMAVAGLAKALTSGDTAGAISLAGQLTNSPDAAIAGKALKIANALEKGNMAVVGSALFDLGKSADKYLQAANSSTSAFEKEINSALDDKTSMSKEVADATQQLIDAFSNPQSTVSYPGTQLADIGKMGDPGSGVYWDSSIGAWRVADEVTDQDLEDLGVGLATDLGLVGKDTEDTEDTEDTKTEQQTPFYSIEELIAQSNAKSQEHGFPDYETEKLYRGDVEAYNRDVAQKAMFASMDPDELAYINHRNQLEGAPGFESLEDFKKYGGDYQAYQYDQMTPWEKDQYDLQQWMNANPQAGAKTTTEGGSSDFENLPITSEDPNRTRVVGGGSEGGGSGLDDGTTDGIQDVITMLPVDDGTTDGIQDVITMLPVDDGTTDGIQDVIDELPDTEEEEEPPPTCEPGWTWNGSMCVADDDNPEDTTTCPVGMVYDLGSQSCVPIGDTTGGGGGVKPTTPATPTTPTQPTQPAPSQKQPTPTGLDLASLLALMGGGGGGGGQTLTPGYADTSGMVDIETLLENPLAVDYRKLAKQSKMASGGSIDDLLELLNGGK